MRERTILHVDMDAFYAAIEQRDDPSLRGRPVVVGGLERGVVAAASYEARAYGIRSAMPMSDALRRCPDLVRVPPRMRHYQDVSRAVFGIFRDVTPLVEGLSLDEAFLDVTESERLLGSGEAMARSIKSRIRATTGLTASVGVAPNKLVAKIASDLGKPDGLVVIGPADCQARLDPLPVAAIPGIGPKTIARLAAQCVRTIADLRRAPDAVLVPVFGRYAARVRARAAGRDDRPVVAEREEKSVSAEETFARDLDEPPDMERALLDLADRVARRLQRQALTAGTLHLKLREADFTTCTRQLALRPATNATDRLYHGARDLLRRWLAEHPGARIRLLGVGTSRLAPALQPDLFPADQAGSGAAPIDATVGAIRERFGDSSVGRARTLEPPRRK